MIFTILSGKCGWLFELRKVSDVWSCTRRYTRTVGHYKSRHETVPRTGARCHRRNSRSSELSYSRRRRPSSHRAAPSRATGHLPDKKIRDTSHFGEIWTKLNTVDARQVLSAAAPFDILTAHRTLLRGNLCELVLIGAALTRSRG